MIYDERDRDNIDFTMGIIIGMFIGSVIGAITVHSFVVQTNQTKAVEKGCGERLPNGNFKWKEK